MISLDEFKNFLDSGRPVVQRVINLDSWSSPSVEFLNYKVMVIPKAKMIKIKDLEGKEYVVKCAKEDEFDIRIGVGLALSRVGKCPQLRKQHSFLRNKLDYKDLAEYYLLEEFDFNKNKANKFIERLKEEISTENKPHWFEVSV